ncbi:MAG: histidine kinase [gamma proteobacterium symbiont of Ctena orbiculata]|nr:MAG: histidine kinase [gamma proteobacterium symbiont of Ctena orbiculata]PVV21033.1 MAG: histidine kinase [gamma proteobacterium symbiont of Ctena orbiculata]
MKIRTQILILLFLFGFAPLTAMVLTNLPFVLERLEFFYHKAYLQNLRADFRDLDEHLASRHEMLRLLAKLPEPGLILGQREREEGREQIDQSRVRYTKWINQILRDHLDIFQILFLDLEGNPRFWLELNSRTQQWEPTIKKPDMPSRDFFQHNIHQEYGRVAVSKISLNPNTSQLDPRRFMTLRMISPIIGPDRQERVAPLGAVVINIDVGGMARAYRNTLWVTNDGTYLDERLKGSAKPRAFEEFTGLQAIFEKKSLALWEGGQGRQVIWVPLFSTEGSGPLWVGRPVDPSPLHKFRNVLISRVMTIVIIALVILFIVARIIALRAEQFGKKLRDGVGRVLREDEPVAFNWRGSQELHQLGQQLTELAGHHAKQAEAQRQHARQLEESNRYKSQFLANVSHELRTPLNSILLLSKMLNEAPENLTTEQRGQLQVIHEAGRDLRALIDNILDLSRIEAGKASISLQQIPVKPLVADLIEMVKPQFDAKGLQLTHEYGDSLPETILSDQYKVRQILKNFLSNALKFTHQGGAKLRIFMHPEEGEHPLCFAVEDSGVGIPKNKHDLIFEAFKQADGSTSRRFGGTGLGLSISRELAHLLGGEVSLDSEEGAGARFTLCLPLELDHSTLSSHQVELQTDQEPLLIQEGIPTLTLTSQPEPLMTPFAGNRILVVDDDLQSLLALTPLLEGWGFEVTAAGDGQEALDTLKDDPDFNIVLMDIMMPELDGYDTIRHIRSKMQLDTLKVIVLSAKNAAEDRKQCLEAGADEVLTKPVTPEKLQALLRVYLESE